MPSVWLDLVLFSSLLRLVSRVLDFIGLLPPAECDCFLCPLPSLSLKKNLLEDSQTPSLKSGPARLCPVPLPEWILAWFVVTLQDTSLCLAALLPPSVLDTSAKDFQDPGLIFSPSCFQISLCFPVAGCFVLSMCCSCRLLIFSLVWTRDWVLQHPRRFVWLDWDQSGSQRDGSLGLHWDCELAYQ